MSRARHHFRRARFVRLGARVLDAADIIFNLACTVGVAVLLGLALAGSCP